MGKGEYTMFIYPRLLGLRESHNIPQRVLADLLGISVQQYSLYERGEREIPLHHVIELAKYYNVSLDYITGLTDNKQLKK